MIGEREMLGYKVFISHTNSPGDMVIVEQVASERIEKYFLYP